MTPSALKHVAPSLRVMTVNLHRGFGLLDRRFVLQRLRESVRDVAPDLVFLQGVHGASRALARRPDLPYDEILADPIWPAYACGRGAMHGNELLSRFPIVRTDNVDFSARRHARAPDRCGLLYCALRVPGRRDLLHAVCVHLGPRRRQRARQMQQLCDFVVRRVPAAEPLLVAGDFNDWRERAHPMLRHCAGLGEVFVEAHGRAARTFPMQLPLLRLDRIYTRSVRDQAPLALPARPWAGRSDHVPLAAEIQL